MSGQAKSEPIAIVGMGCRLPAGIRTPAAFWEFLNSSKSGITRVPSGRWDAEAYYSKDRAHAGKVISVEGGFLDGIDLFDPGFFGISDTEAPYIDPQQRILLEVTWEAFERAGLVMDQHRGGSVGVFIGCFTADYLHIQFADPYEVAAYTATGAVGTMVAARISHTFDFRGPSMTVDTACSSSLHSVHLACESLRAGDSDVAIAGGTQLTLIPEFNIAESKAGFLSDASQCRTFDAGARGYVRSEGVGIVVLKRLADAVAAGDPIQAIILGSAMNQDGRTPSIAQPNFAAQIDVMRRACERAGIAPAAVHYVEAHGTGTSAGDRAEAEAIGTVFRVKPGCNDPLLVGSCKSNIGHTEAAAGICGLIKAALCVKHSAVPPNLHFETPNPAIGFDYLRICVPVTLTPIGGRPPVACVNSFGFGGSNAAVVLRGPDEFARPDEVRHRTFLLPLSSHSSSTLRECAHRIDSWIGNSVDAIRVNDLCHTAGVHRTHHAHRRAFVFDRVDSLREQLRSLTEENPAHDYGQGTAWVFSGAGSQRYQTGLRLREEEPVFRTVLEQCDEIYRGLAGFSLIEVMGSNHPGKFIQEAWLAHPVTVTIQLGLAALFRSWGLKPAAIVGHSLGETAAFHVAGVYTLEQALLLTFHRCESLKPLHGAGGLLAVAADEESIRTVLGDVAIAALNGPAAITLSGFGSELSRAQAALTAAGIRSQLLSELFPCHHRYPALESAAQKLADTMRAQQGRNPSLPLYSTVTGDALTVAPLSSYWATHLLESVKLRPVISLLAKQGVKRFLEVGAHPVLSAAIAATAKNPVRVFPSLHSKRNERSALLNSVGGLYECGERIDWSALYPSGETLDLPLYAWQRQRFWREPDSSLRRTRPVTSLLLGQRSTAGRTSWRAEISAEMFPFLLDHRIAGEAFFPGAAYVDMALSAGRQHFENHPFVIEDLMFFKAIPINRRTAFFTDFELDSANGTFSIYATPSLTVRSVQRVAAGRLRSLPPGASVPPDPPPVRRDIGVLGEHLYERFAKRRYDYRGAFRGIQRAWSDGEQAFCEIEGPVESAGYSFHPAILDSAFQSLLCIQSEDPAPRALEVPHRIGSIRVLGTPTNRMFVWAESRGELRIFDDSERLVAHITGFSTRRMGGLKSAMPMEDCLYQTEWQPHEIGPVTNVQNAVWLLLSGRDEVGERFAKRLTELGVAQVVLGSPVHFDEVLSRHEALAGVIHLGNAASNDTCCPSLLSLACDLSRRGDHPKLWVITKGAHQLKPSDPSPDPFQAASWGLCRAIGQREMPAIWGGLIDLSRKCLPCEIGTAAAAILSSCGEDQLAFRQHDSFKLRLQRMPQRDTRAPEIAFRDDRPYIVTGAFGALGGEVARWMVARGARRLILPTRRDQHRGSALVRYLESAGAAIEVPILNLSDANEVSTWCTTRRTDSICGVIYCAGLSRDQLAASTDIATFNDVFNTKVAGAWAMDHALRDAPLEHFVLFGSVASVLPNPGMGAYAAANRCLDALASYRRTLGLPGLSIAWGPWEIGMTECTGVKEHLDRAGLRCFSAEQGVRLLERLWHSDYPEPLALAVDWERVSAQSYMQLPILNDLLCRPSADDSSDHRVSAGAPQERLQTIATRLISTNNQLDVAIPLVEQGLDSLGATVLVETLYRDFGVSIESDALAEGLSLQDLMDLVANSSCTV